MCAADDDYNDPADMIEPPVPHDIAEFSTVSGDFLSFFGLDPLLLIVAGKDVDNAPVEESKDQVLAQWINELDDHRVKDLLLEFLIKDTAVVKAGLLTEIRDLHITSQWPTTDKQRSFDELLEEAATLRDKENEKQARKAQLKAKKLAEKAERRRLDRMQEMVKDPERWLRESEQRVSARGTRNYELAVVILNDLRDAVGGEKGEEITRRHAAYLTNKHPTLNYLKGALRKRGLLE